jgi:hypothetical protein
LPGLANVPAASSVSINFILGEDHDDADNDAAAGPAGAADPAAGAAGPAATAEADED